MVDRMIVLPTGAIHDLDGTDDAALTPANVWWELVFQAAYPSAHTQYANLLGLVGKKGTLTAKLLTAGVATSYTATARLRPLEGTWEAPYATATANQLIIKATWQLTGFWA
jgi:hypothetical protein